MNPTAEEEVDDREQNGRRPLSTKTDGRLRPRREGEEEDTEGVSIAAEQPTPPAAAAALQASCPSQ